MPSLDFEPKLKTPLLRIFLWIVVAVMFVIVIRDSLDLRWMAVSIDLVIAGSAAVAVGLLSRIGYTRISVAAAYGFTLLEMFMLFNLGYHNENSFFLVVDILVLLILFATVFVQRLKHIAGVILLASLFLTFHIVRSFWLGQVTTHTTSVSQQLFGPVLTFVLVSVMALIIRIYFNRINGEYRALAEDREKRRYSQGQLIRGLSHHLNTPLGNSKVVLSFQAETEAACIDPEMQMVLTNAIDASIAVVGRLGEFMKQTEHAVLSTLSGGSLAEYFSLQQSQPVHMEETPAVTALTSGHCPHYWNAISFVVAELIHNARIHTTGDGAVPQVSLAMTPRQELTITVLNGGPGISPEALARVREPFFSTTMVASHPGLGLYFADYICQHLLAGRLVIDSQPEQGTRVSMVFPSVPRP